MKKNKSLLFLFFFFIALFKGYSQGYYATKYDTKDGLLDRNCKGLFQDKKGFLWIMNGGGLSRFDGKHFLNYKDLPIRFSTGGAAFAERDSGLYFASSMPFGLGVFSKGKFSFLNFPDKITKEEKNPFFPRLDKHGKFFLNNNFFDGKNVKKIPVHTNQNKWIQNYLLDNNKDLWYLPFNHKGENDSLLVHIDSQRKYSIPLKGTYQFEDIFVVSPNLLYALVVATGKKVLILKIENGKSSTIHLSGINFTDEGYTNAQLTVFKNKALLVFDYDFYKIDLDYGKILNKIHFDIGQQLPPNLLLGNNELLIYDKVLNFKTFKFSPFCPNLNLTPYATIVNQYLKDTEGNVWISTNTGLYKCNLINYKLYSDSLTRYKYISDDVAFYSRNDTIKVNSKKGTKIYTNTKQNNKNILNFDSRKGNYYFFLSASQIDKSHVHRYGQELLVFKDDSLVFKLDKTQLNHSNKFIKSFDEDIVTDDFYILQLNKNEFSEKRGSQVVESPTSILFFNYKKNKLDIHYQNDLYTGNYVGSHFNNLYFVKDSTVLIEFNLEKKRLTSYNLNLTEFRNLSAAQNDKNQFIINCLDVIYKKENGIFKQYKIQKQNNLLGFGRAIDASGAFIFNNKHLHKTANSVREYSFDKNSCQIKTYLTADKFVWQNILTSDNRFSLGITEDKTIQLTDYKEMSSHSIEDLISADYSTTISVLQNGSFVFSDGKRGYFELNPYLDISNIVAPKIYIESVYLSTNEFGILNEPLDDKTINYFKKYIDAHSEFKFNFVGICLRDGNKVRYKYKLEGYDTDWVDGQDVTFAKYKNVPAGNYTFLVKACNNDGVWSLEPASFSFTIPTPFYQSWWFITLCVLTAVGLIYLLIKSREKQLRKKNDALEKTVQQRTHEIELQKEIVEEKNKEITDSINYAQRIQRALLASKKLLNENLNSQPIEQNSYFIYFQPKDVVSGDFYWASKLKNENFALVTADSTGHGVPGAFMSLLNISCLNEAINERGFIDSKDILNHTRKRVIASLAEDGSAEGGKDGMDCSILVFDKEKKNLMYTAANNPVWIIRNSDSEQKEIIELLPDKMPVGKHDRDYLSFTSTTIPLQKGDIIYTLTDGFPDQFGGPKAKKFKYKPLQQLLLSICDEEMEVQQQKLKQALENWKGILEQVDDILIIGIKV